MASKKRKSTKEIIEETPFPNIEHIFVRYPGKESLDITDYKNSNGDTVRVDNDKLEEYLVKHNKRNPYFGRIKPFSIVHTHPSEATNLSYLNRFFQFLTYGIWDKHLRRFKKISALPSAVDLRIFLRLPIKSFPIAVRDYKTGKVLGYNVLVKTKETPDEKDLGEYKKYLKYYDKERVRSFKKDDSSIARKAYDQILARYNLRSRFVSAESYQPNEHYTTFVPKQILEKRVEGIVASALLLSSLFFLSPNLTGNFMGINQNYFNEIGIIFFIIGIILGFHYFMRKN